MEANNIEQGALGKANYHISKADICAQCVHFKILSYIGSSACFCEKNNSNVDSLGSCDNFTNRVIR